MWVQQSQHKTPDLSWLSAADTCASVALKSSPNVSHKENSAVFVSLLNFRTKEKHSWPDQLCHTPSDLKNTDGCEGQHGWC